jgi:GNAT superfamily N-acetyltransferase
MHDLVIRRPMARELVDVRSLVQEVVDETYAGLWAPAPLPIGDENWSRAWVAASGSALAGVVLTREQWIDDLWVRAPYRGRGVGGMLLMHAEAEIARQYGEAKLRVVEVNRRAQAFYVRQGWRGLRAYPHETAPITMIEMVKTVRSAK